MESEPFVLIGAGLLLALGSFLPWATASLGVVTVNVNGTSGDGRITLGLALGALAISAALLWIDRSKPLYGLAGVGMIAAIALCVRDMAQLPTPSTSVGVVHFGVSIGVGLWICLVASVVGLMTAGYALLRTGGDEAIDVGDEPIDDELPG